MKLVIAGIAVLSLACFSNAAQAENGRNGAALLGGAAGVAIGAAGATMLMNNSQRRPAPVMVEEEEIERPVERCSMRMMDLFDRDGNFVKKDRVRICR